MEDKQTLARYRRWYRRLLRCYPRPHRERFAESMEQTFADLCRERARADGRGFVTFIIWIFVETFAGMIRENATNTMRCAMARDSTHFLKLVKCSAIALAALMVAGIVTLMFLARGTGEDITGIVAPALLITILSSVVAISAAVMQRREPKASDVRPNDDLTG